jgi:hypothetical protein
VAVEIQRHLGRGDDDAVCRTVVEVAGQLVSVVITSPHVT